MTKPVYVAYNWLAPEGPLENLSSPDLYDLAAHENRDLISVDTLKSKTNQTDFGHRCVDKHERFKINGIASMTPSDHFIYPITLGWKDEMQRLFNMENGIFERNRVPKATLDLIRNHRGYLVLEHGWESFCTWNDFDIIHRYVRYHNIPSNKTIYITGTANVQALYDDYCRARNIDSRILVMPYLPALEGYAENICDADMPEYDPSKLPTKTFLSLNYRPRPHRTMLLALFNKHNLLSDSYFSFCGMHDDQHIGGTYDNTHIGGLYLDHIEIDCLQDRLSEFILDNNWPETYCDVVYDSNNAGIAKYYEDSLVNITTETSFYTDIISVTEKSFKPMRYMQPFVMVSTQGTLKNLTDMGFKSFSDCWDESYDSESNPALRLKKVIEICNQISNWTPTEVKEFRAHIKPRLEHNFKLLKNMTTGPVYQKLVDTVTQVNTQ